MFFRGSKVSRTKGDQLKERYLLEWKIAANAYADAYAARRKESHQKVVVWVGREALSSNQWISFKRQIKKLKRARVSDIQEYGMSGDNMGFVVLSTAAYKRLDFDRPSAARLRRRFIFSLLVIERLHQRGIVCGNLSSDSFLLDGDERLRFVDSYGFLPGDPRAPAVSDAFLTYRRRIDEQLCRVSEESDAYALSVIGLQLFGARFPPGYIEPTQLPDCLKEMREDAPQWVYSILLKNVQNPDTLAFKSSSELVAAIILSEKNSEQKPATDGVKEEPPEEISYHISLDQSEVGTGSPLGKMTAAGLLAFALFTIAMATVAIQFRPGTQVDSQLHNGEVFDFKNSLDDKFRNGLERLAASDDPSIHEKFDEILKNSRDAGALRFVWSVMAERASRLGLRRTGAVLREMTLTLKDDALQSLAEISKAFDPYQDAMGRGKLFEEYSRIDPHFVCNLVVAASLDGEQVDDFRDLLRRCLSREEVRNEGVKEGELSSLAMIVVLDRERMRYSDDIKARAGELPEADVRWLFGVVDAKEGLAIRTLAHVALSKNLVLWPRRIFMRILESTASSGDMPIPALLHSAMSGPSEADIDQYTAWYDGESIKALVAVLLEEGEESLRSQAFDALDNKPISDELTRGLLEFLKTGSSVSRGIYGGVVGAVAFRDELTPDTFSRYLQSVQGSPMERDIDLFLLYHGDAKLIKAVLETKGSTINPVSLVQLLKSSDPEVRALVIPFLKTITVASSRRAVRDYYLQERSPEVRSVFEREIPNLGR